jgi:hypothetical protein
MNEQLDKLGILVIRHLHDKILREADTLLSGASKAPAAQSIQSSVCTLSEAHKEAIRQLVLRATITGIHDYLFAVQSSLESEVKFTANGVDLSDLSDGLHGELFGQNGWIGRFSQYKNEK